MFLTFGKILQVQTCFKDIKGMIGWMGLIEDNMQESGQLTVLLPGPSVNVFFPAYKVSLEPMRKNGTNESHYKTFSLSIPASPLLHLLSPYAHTWPEYH